MNSAKPADETLEWVAHPASEHPVWAALAVMGVAMIAGALYQVTGTLIYSALTAIVLPVTLAPFFIPARYVLNSDSVVMEQMGRRKKLLWKDVRQVTVNRQSVYLSPYPGKSIRQRRGILILSAGKQKQIIDFIEKML